MLALYRYRPAVWNRLNGYLALLFLTFLIYLFIAYSLGWFLATWYVMGASGLMWWAFVQSDQAYDRWIRWLDEEPRS